MDQSTAEDALKKLEPLVGHWRLTATPPGGPPWPGEGRAIFEWHDSGANLVERTTVDIPGVPDGVSIIGCDAGNGTYFQLYSDDRGVCRVYEMSIGDSEWRLWREGAPIAQRFTGRLDEDGRTITGHCEIAEGGTNYTPDFDLTYTRVEWQLRSVTGSPTRLFSPLESVASSAIQPASVELFWSRPTDTQSR